MTLKALKLNRDGQAKLNRDAYRCDLVWAR